MPIYISMIVLTVFFGVLAQRTTNNKVTDNTVIQPNINDTKEIKEQRNMVFLLLILGVFVFVTGFQSGFGDTTSYLSQFMNLKYSFEDSLVHSWDNKSPLFQIYMALIKSFTQDGQWLLLITAFITNLLVWNVMRKESASIPVACYLYICSGLCLWAMNGIRQYLAATILFAAYKLIIDGKWIKWFLLLFIVYFIHTSVVFLVPIYFLYRKKPWQKTTLLLIVFVLLIGIFYTQFSNSFFEIAQGTVFEEYKTQVAEVASTKIIRTAFMMIPAILSFIYRKEIEKTNSPLLFLSSNAALLSAGIYFLASIGAGNLIGRIAVYSDLFVYIVLMPYILKTISISRYNYVGWIYLIAAGVFYWYQMFIVYSGVWWSVWLGWHF